MSSINKIKVGSTIYDVSPSPTGILDNTAYTSGDVAQSSATSWINTDQLVSTETNASIFTKITQMIRNIRYLYNLIGTGTFSTTNTITKVVNNKANNVHSHTTSDIPVNTICVNSTSSIPTSSLLYTLNNGIIELSDRIDAFKDSLIPDPNTQYDSSHTLIYTINNINDANTFCNTYNNSNKYNGLKLGQRIQINDGTYNKAWYIAGFDVEHEQKAADGTTYDNGYGIALAPEYDIGNSQWNATNTTSGGYLNSYIHTTTLPTVANKLKNVLGTHLINRNVLLSSNTSSGKSSAYTWTTAYCTLPSVGQLTGTFASNYNKYDDGEANYKLPLFNFMEYKTGSTFWSRGIASGNYAWSVYGDGSIYSHSANYGYGVRPLIYIR